MTDEIEFESVTLRLPKALINYVSRIYGDTTAWLERFVVDWLRIDVENKTGEELIELFGLRPVFKAIFGEDS